MQICPYSTYLLYISTLHESVLVNSQTHPSMRRTDVKAEELGKRHYVSSAHSSEHLQKTMKK